MNLYLFEAETKPKTLIDLLRCRAASQPDQLAYTFLTNGETDGTSYTYRELDQQARSIGAYLQQNLTPGERILLLYPPGLEYIAAFFGCLYAGVVAIPAYPPRLRRTDDRIPAIIANAGVTFALAHPTLLPQLDDHAARSAQFAALRCLTAPVPGAGLPERWTSPDVTEESLAFLQYTSGSTAAPKGVMLTHRNLVHNLARIQQCFEHTPASKGVIWLPPYHDMGLIGGILQPLYAGFPVTLMSPAAFLQSPIRWLQTITREQATTSGGPNFAFDLCIHKITAEQRATLDLRSWEVAFTGAEPIRPETLRRFSDTFAPCGFRPEAFYPCYGLAEATLIVSGGAKAAPPVVQPFQMTAFGAHQIVEGKPGDDMLLLVGCGQTQPEDQVRIVDAQTGQVCGPNQIGEIWVAGPGVAQGYWNDPAATAQSFAAHVAGEHEGPFLRTGDLGFLRNGELFVTGRLKDLIIIRGRNYYPHDIELTVERAHPALRSGCAAAFSIEVEGAERLVIVSEVERQQRKVDVDEVAGIIRQMVSAEHELQVYAVALLTPGSIPKTSSGKIQRQACRTAYLSDTLSIIGRSVLHRSTTHEPAETLNRDLVLATAPAEQHSLLMGYLNTQLRQIPGLATVALKPDQSLHELGIDSLTAIEVRHRLETDLGVDIPFTWLLQDTRLHQIVEEILSQILATTEPLSLKLMPAREPPMEYPLSHGQRAMWVLHQLAPTSAAYNISRTVRIRHALDTGALYRALRQLVMRHEALRTIFAIPGGEPLQRVRPDAHFDFFEEDATSWHETRLYDRLAAEAQRPFDLEHGPLLRVAIFACPSDEHMLLFVAHHIVVDFWSLAVLLRELSALYAGELSDQAVTLPVLKLRYSDYVQWQTTMLAGPAGERLWAYWRERLAGDLPVLNLPTDRSRPPVQTYHGAAHYFSLSAEVFQRIQELGTVQGVTLYMTLLAAFQTLLFRLTDQEDILVGSPTASRDLPELTDVVGYYINPIVLRTKLNGTLPFTSILAQVRQLVLEAFSHQMYPFGLLTERLQPSRDASRSPLFQAMFVLQQDPIRTASGLASLAVGESGSEVALGALAFEPVVLKEQTAQFDLTLMIAQADSQLSGVLQYNTDLFDPSTIARIAGYFQTLLGELIANPERPIGRLSLLTGAEYEQIVVKWNASATDLPQLACLHEQIQAQVACTPDRIAVVFEDQTLTYQALDRRANQLAHYLRYLGVRPGMIVGICLERSLDLIAGLLGILKAGGAYLPLDPTYPAERLQFMVEDAQVSVVVTQQRLALTEGTADLVFERCRRVYLDADWDRITQEPTAVPAGNISPDQLAYVIYTSGSTGKPKGVLIRHASVVNFFIGMDQRVGCSEHDTLLALTSISFDISVLELFWTLARGAKVVLVNEQAVRSGASLASVPSTARGIDFSLFYFASAASAEQGHKYRLLFEGARFADQHGFAAIWTPERHFHDFGGLYPNPAVTSAALAVQTERIAIRAGSVVLPLHHPVRVAEEWAVVDNMANGRVGLAFASGWHANDFIFFPDQYPDRKEVMLQGIQTVQRLWRGETVLATDGTGNSLPVQLYPAPIQPDLPIWLTAAGSPETFIKAGELGVGVLTHLLGQNIKDLAEKIQMYRAALATHGHPPEAAHVTLMLHTFIGEDRDVVREQVREPFTNYLRSSISLIHNLITSLGLPLDLATMSKQDMDDLLAFAFDRYFDTSALFGTPASCLEMIDQLKAIGVDEVACLIDFGLDTEAVLSGLNYLDQLRQQANQITTGEDYSLAAQAIHHQVTLMQCTPSTMRLLGGDTEIFSALGSLRCLLLGGEALAPSLAQELQAKLPVQLINMYGPTETTIWSATHTIDKLGSSVPIGVPIANTQIYILDRYLQPVPVGMAGELYIGGEGLALGYLHRPALTAERFLPDPFSDGPDPRPGARLYRTGDLARYQPDGTIEYLGRIDHQIKLRGFRIELGEIESALLEHPRVWEATVVAREDAPDDRRLVAYFVPAVTPAQSANGQVPAAADGATHDSDSSQVSAADEPSPLSSELYHFLEAKLPSYMVPSTFVELAALPLTPSGKVDRKKLPTPDRFRPMLEQTLVAPRTALEQAITDLWVQMLNLEQVGIYDNFFALGGHSLLAIQLLSRVRATLEVDIPVHRFFQDPTIAGLSQHIEMVMWARQGQVAPPVMAVDDREEGRL